MSSVEFLKESFLFEDNVNIDSKGNRVEWDFKGDPQGIVHIQPGCGCTASCRIEGNQILADYNEQDARKKVVVEDIPRLYPDNKYAFSKNVIVYLMDDQPLHIVNDRGIKQLNPQKAKVTLTFGGYVDLSPLLVTDESD